MKSFSLPKNPVFAFLLVFLGIVLLGVIYKRVVDEGFAPYGIKTSVGKITSGCRNRDAAGRCFD